MKYFFDTEFLDDGKTIEAISIGIKAEDGRELYEEFDFNEERVYADEWLVKNVVPHLSSDTAQRKSKERIKLILIDFIGNDPNPEFWAWYASYDWVVLCQLFGPMINLPKSFPKYVKDLKFICDINNISSKDLPKIELGSHNALVDARWLNDSYKYVENILASFLMV